MRWHLAMICCIVICLILSLTYSHFPTDVSFPLRLCVWMPIWHLINSWLNALRHLSLWRLFLVNPVRDCHRITHQHGLAAMQLYKLDFFCNFLTLTVKFDAFSGAAIKFKLCISCLVILTHAIGNQSVNKYLSFCD